MSAALWVRPDGESVVSDSPDSFPPLKNGQSGNPPFSPHSFPPLKKGGEGGFALTQKSNPPAASRRPPLPKGAGKGHCHAIPSFPRKRESSFAHRVKAFLLFALLFATAAA